MTEPTTDTPTPPDDSIHGPSSFEDQLSPTTTVEPPVEVTDPRRRFNLRGRTLREHAARGTLINTGFLIGLSFLQFLRGFIIAAFLVAEDYGVYGTLAISMGMLLLLKSLGVGDKYVQQDEDDQEVAFQKAWTLEAMLTGLVMVLLLAALPLIVLLYGEERLFLPGLVMIATLPAGLLQMPVFVYYRRMEFLRQRILQSIEPVVAFAVGVTLAALGGGYWAIFIGIFVGAYAAGIASLIHAPYKIRIRYDAGTLREYWSFSWPLLAAAGGGMVIAQSSIIAAEYKLGLAGAGLLTLAANITFFTDRVDRLVTGSLYPAICAVRDRSDLLFESFVKSNRLALMWAVPFGFGLTLFASDLVAFGIGEKWRPVVVLLQVYGVVAAIGHIGFNWEAYLRATGDTRPIAVASAAAAVTFLLTAIPLLFAYELRGFAIGVGLQMLVHLGFRAYYLGKLFLGFAFLPHAARAMLPVIPGVVVVLVARAAESGPRTALLAVAEAIAYGCVVIAATVRLERGLLSEVIGYIRARPVGATG